MIISPTRELAIQIFDVLCSIGKHGHLFAAGLVIGGKSLQEEQHALARMNIVVCTPGRILQHLSQTAAFSVDNLQMLVLDEADRILDMGFQRDVDAIIEYLPPSPQRQTLLFSATQTKKVSDLARLSLKDPEYIAVHEASSAATPKTLQQNYVLTPLPEKLNTLWSFLLSAKKSKLLIFLSSGKQVRFVYEAFRKMQPGIPLMHLHGRQKQTARLEVTSRFSSAKHACLFATDVVARGLDFPAVDWVMQADCPEDPDTYIHRVGRTARYERDGRAVLFLDPNEEEGMLERLAAKKVPIERINVRTKKQTSVTSQMQGLCFKDPELKYLGQKAFISYVKSLMVQKDKDVFDVRKYDLEGFAASLGLPGAPQVKFLKAGADVDAQKKLKNASRQAAVVSDDDSGAENMDGVADGRKAGAQKPRTRYDRMFERTNQDILSSHYSRVRAADEVEEAPASDVAETLNGNSVDSSTQADAGVNDTGQVSSGSDAADEDRDQEDDLFSIKRRILPPTTSGSSPSHSAPNSTTTTNTTNTTSAALKTTTTPLNPDSNRLRHALTSKAKTAKLLASSKNPSYQSKHILFDPETGEVHDAKVPMLEDENAVGRDKREREEARRRFVEREEGRVREVDVGDRMVEKERRRVRRLKAKMRERGKGGGVEAEVEVDDKQGVDDGNLDGDIGEGHDGEMERIERPFDDLADLYSDEGDAYEVPESARPGKKRRRDVSNAAEATVQDGVVVEPKKQKKHRKERKSQSSTQPQSIEELEAMAKGLLG